MELYIESSQAEFDSHLYNTHGISDNSITIAAARPAAKPALGPGNHVVPEPCIHLLLLSTVKSIQRGDFPTRRAAAARAAPSTPRLVSAARVGPVVYGLLLTFRGDGYG